MDEVLIAICIIIIIIYLCSRRESFKSTKTCNDVDGRCYPVADKFQSKKGASEMLAEVNTYILTFMDRLRQKYMWVHDHPDTYRVNLVKRIFNNYSPDSLMENAPKDDKNTSYVQNKGDIFAICLREKQTGKNELYRLEMLKFVIIHEMAHLSSATYGHDASFWMNFKILLHDAHEFGMYDPIDYSITPYNYCSLHVDYNPYFDSDIPI